MSKWVVDIHGNIEGDYEIIEEYKEPKKTEYSIERAIAIEDKIEELTERVDAIEKQLKEERGMTREEAKQIFLDRGFVNGVFDGNKWKESVIVISKWLEQESALDKIRGEIKDAAFDLQGMVGEDEESLMVVDLNDVLNIINKYTIGREFMELPNNMCTQRYCLKNHNLGIIECNEECYNRTLF